VIDLTNQGFELIGGRLDYLEQQPVTALVYKRRQHYINVFIWPRGDGSTDILRHTTMRGYHVNHWGRSGFNFWVVSDLNESELNDFSRLLGTPPG